MRIEYKGLRSGNSRVAIITYGENEENKAYEIAHKFTITTSYKVDTLVYGMLLIEVDDMNDFNNVKEWYKEFKKSNTDNTNETNNDTDNTNETKTESDTTDTESNTTDTNNDTDNTTKTNNTTLDYVETTSYKCYEFSTDCKRLSTAINRMCKAFPEISVDIKELKDTYKYYGGNFNECDDTTIYGDKQNATYRFIVEFDGEHCYICMYYFTNETDNTNETNNDTDNTNETKTESDTTDTESDTTETTKNDINIKYGVIYNTITKLEKLFDTAEKYKNSYTWYKDNGNAQQRVYKEKQDSIDEFEWIENGDKYTAEYVVRISRTNVYAYGLYTKNEHPTTLTVVKNSYKRLLKAVQRE